MEEEAKRIEELKQKMSLFCREYNLELTETAVICVNNQVTNGDIASGALSFQNELVVFQQSSSLLM